ncbi:MAG: HEPN domain-containing protein [Phycisphaerae bacterium]|nr:HEPN domain-containing protein [Phycisphaerae bacterium]
MFLDSSGLICKLFRVQWNELAKAQFRAAALLVRAESGERPSCSRAYYAAYALVAHRLEPANITYAFGWKNPAHADLPRYVAQIAGIGPASKRAIRRALRRLRQRREDADYRPRITVDPSAARESLRDAAELFRILGESHEP